MVKTFNAMLGFVNFVKIFSKNKMKMEENWINLTE